MKNNKIVFFIFSIATLFLGVVFIVWSGIPYLQMRSYYRAADRVYSGETTALSSDSFAFRPYTYIQPKLRQDLLTRIFQADLEGRSALIAPVLPFAIENMEEVIERSAMRPEYYLSLGRAYSLLAKFGNNDAETNLAIAEGYYKEALKLRPESQEVIYPYSINLSNQGKFAEAIALLESIQLPDAETSYYFGIAHFRAGEAHYSDALKYLEQSLEAGTNKDDTLTRSVYTKLFGYYYGKKDIQKFITVLDRLLTIDSENKEMYTKIKAYIDVNNRLPTIRIQ